MVEADPPGIASRWGQMNRKAELVTDMRMIDNTSVLLGEGPEAITSSDNIIRVAKFRHEWIKKYLDTCG